MLSMAEFGKGILRNNEFNDMALFDDDHQDGFSKKSCWVIMESGDHHHHHREISSSDVSSISSSSSSLSSDLTDDASSSSSSSSPPHSNGPLYELSELMTQLPIKRGLSKYFQGKSQSFTSLSKVMSVEELAKKENPFNARRRMKACKSFAANLDAHKFSYTISKKPPRSSSLSFSPRKKTNQIPPTPFMQTNF